MMNLQKWADQYLVACKYQKGLDSKTIKAYQIDLSQFILFTVPLGADLTRTNMMEYIADLHQKYMDNDSYPLLFQHLYIKKHPKA